LRALSRTERNEIQGAIKKIKEIKKALEITSRSLHEKMEKLESERTELLIEIERRRRTGERQTNDLESEVRILRDDVETMKKVLDNSNE
jgi:predicted  nucleic acid-binding Zn-ribbon protein